MYRISFKGNLGDEFVDDGPGSQLMRMWEEGTLPDKVKINDSLYESKSIKAIQSEVADPDHSDAKERGLQHIRESEEQFQKVKAHLFTLTAEERAQSTQMADMLSMAIQNRRLTEEEKQIVIARQTEFFKKNPDYAFANPLCYKDLLKAHRPITQRGMKRLSDYFPEHAMNYALKVVRNGIQ